MLLYIAKKVSTVYNYNEEEIMGKILLDIPHIPDCFISAENLDEAISRLKALKTGTGKESLLSLKRFKGIVQQSVDPSEEDWYKQ